MLRGNIFTGDSARDSAGVVEGAAGPEVVVGANIGDIARDAAGVGGESC